MAQPSVQQALGLVGRIDLAGEAATDSDSGLCGVHPQVPDPWCIGGTAVTCVGCLLFFAFEQRDRLRLLAPAVSNNFQDPSEGSGRQRSFFRRWDDGEPLLNGLSSFPLGRDSMDVANNSAANSRVSSDVMDGYNTSGRSSRQAGSVYGETEEIVRVPMVWRA